MINSNVVEGFKTINLDVSGLSKGNYLVSISTINDRAVKKLIIIE